MARQPYLLPANASEARRVKEAAADDFFVDNRCTMVKHGKALQLNDSPVSRLPG